MATIQVILANGTTADANEVMDNFDEIYANIDNSNISASAAIAFSKLASLTSGRILVGSSGNVATAVAMSGNATLSNAGVITVTSATNATFTTPTISSPTFSGTIAGSPTFSSSIAFSSNINLTGQLYFDGTTGDNRIYLQSANRVDLVVGGTVRLITNSTFCSVVNAAFSVNSNNNLYLDGGVNDYWVNSANGVNQLYSAGTLTLATNSSGEVLFAAVDPPTANYSNRNGNTKAWAFSNSGGTVQASYNVTSVVRNSAGNYTVTWNTDFSTANYTVSITPAGSGGRFFPSYGNKVAGSIQVFMYDESASALADQAFDIIAIGTQ